MKLPDSKASHGKNTKFLHGKNICPEEAQRTRAFGFAALRNRSDFLQQNFCRSLDFITRKQCFTVFIDCHYFFYILTESLNNLQKKKIKNILCPMNNGHHFFTPLNIAKQPPTAGLKKQHKPIRLPITLSSFFFFFFFVFLALVPNFFLKFHIVYIGTF